MVIRTQRFRGHGSGFYPSSENQRCGQKEKEKFKIHIVEAVPIWVGKEFPDTQHSSRERVC